MDKDVGFFIGFFAILILLALSTRGGGGVFSNLATTTTGGATGTQSVRTGGTVSSGGVTQSGTSPGGSNTTLSSNRYVYTPPAPTKRLSNDEIERKIERLYRELGSLSEKLRVAKLHEPASPYAGMVTLRAGNARNTNPEQEYVMLTAAGSNVNPVNISSWYLQSYVTEESAALPQGDRVIERWRYPKLSDIYLLKNETAYVLTGESPLNASFHENKCTGYLTEYESFYPFIGRNCPAPMAEMEKFGNIDLDDDSCYDYVRRLPYCREPDEDTFGDADLSGACRRFITSTLSYNDCVTRHVNDPFFDDVGYWHIYLDRDDDLWRSQREIIRLMDEKDRVVDVIEY